MTDDALDTPTPAYVESIGDRIAGALQELTGGLDASTVFGPAEHVGDLVIIPAAAVERAGGFGFGVGSGGEPEGDRGEGGGGGGGGSSAGRPVAVIEISPAGVTVRPVFDYTKLGMAFLAAMISTWRIMRK